MTTHQPDRLQLRQQLQSSFSVDDYRRQNNNNLIQLRRQKRNEANWARRQKTANEDSQYLMFGDDGEFLKFKSFPELLREYLPNLCDPNSTIEQQILALKNLILQNERFDVKLIALRVVRLAASSNAPPLHLFVIYDILSLLVDLIFPGQDINILVEACWCLSNFASKDADKTQIMFEKGAIPKLISILNGQYPEVIENAVWALANMFSDDDTYRQQGLEEGILQKFYEILNFDLDLQCLRVIAWCMHNLVLSSPICTAEYTDQLIELVTILEGKVQDELVSKDCI